MTGRTIHQYEVLEKLGDGGMGSVYRARDTKLNRFVALKFLSEELVTDSTARKRFVREAEAASALNHDNICVIHDICSFDDNRMFIVMPCYSGKTLREIIPAEGMEIALVKNLMTQVAEGLARAHQAGIVHRDIKPGNIMITEDGVAKILDFGLAKLSRDRTLTSSGVILGTPFYMSPEQWMDDPVDHRADIWSLGAVTHEMLTGKRPFEALPGQWLMYEVVNDDPQPVSKFRDDAPPQLETLVLKCLAKKPEERYQSIEDLLVDLKSISLDSAAPDAATHSRDDEQSEKLPAMIASKIAKLLSGPRWRFPLLAASAAIVLLAIAVEVGRFADEATPSSPPISAVDTTRTRSLKFWMTVQKDTRDTPLRVPGPMLFERGYILAFSILPSERGYLYLVNEGPITANSLPQYNLMFPTTTLLDGKALLEGNATVKIPPSGFIFDSERGTEKVWLVWSNEPVGVFDALGAVNRQNRGQISGIETIDSIRRFLEDKTVHSGHVRRQEEEKQTILQTDQEILVHLIRLEHL